MQLLISGSYNAFSDGYNAAGIYLASGLIPSESYTRPIYVGSAVNMKTRIVSQHIPQLTCLDHINKPMQSYAAKYGIENIVWFALETHELETIASKELLPLEQTWFDELQPFARLKQGFNICEKAGSTAGVEISEETRLKMSKAAKARIVSDETRKKLSEALFKQYENGRRSFTPERLIELAEQYSKPFSVINPEGQLITGTNLTRFCRENQLTRTNLIAVLKGRSGSHKGWTKPKESEGN